MKQSILDAACRGIPIYAECGGFMYLCETLIDPDGAVYPMAGCFPFTVEMNRRLRSLGYREVTLSQPTLLGIAGTAVRGHEFHYSALVEAVAAPEVSTVFSVSPRAGGPPEATGYFIRQTLGSYLHLHFGSNPAAADGFVDSCRQYRKRHP